MSQSYDWGGRLDVEYTSIIAHISMKVNRATPHLYYAAPKCHQVRQCLLSGHHTERHQPML